MANKTVLKKEKNLNSRREVVTVHPVMRTLIYSLIFPNRQTAYRIHRTNTYSVKKYIYFWKTMINTAAKSILVQLCYYMTRDFHRHSQEPTAKRQFLQKSASNFLKSRAAVSVKKSEKKYNLNGISTALRRHVR